MFASRTDKQNPERKDFFLGLRGAKLQTAQIWAVVLPAYFLFGYNNGVAGPLLNLGPWVASFPSIDTVTTSGAERAQNARVQGTVVALYTVGAMVGSLATTAFGDRLGRIRTLQVGAVVSVIGAALSSSSFSLGQLIVGRLVVGLGTGTVSATTPIWQSECAAAEHRGAAVLYESVFISLGLAVGGWIELGLSFAADGPVPSVSWRFSLALPAFVAILILVFLPFFPESPRWLLKHDRTAEAVDALSALLGSDASSPSVQESIREMQDSLSHTGREVKFLSIFRNNTAERLLHRTVLASAGLIFQQVCGINAIAFYTSLVFEQYLGFSGTASRAISAAVFSWQTICAPLGVLTVDRLGRRPLMLTSALGMGVCMAVIAGTGSSAAVSAGTSSSSPSSSSSSAAAGVAAAFIFVYASFFPVGFLTLPFLYAAEVAPLGARVPVTAFSSGVAWLFNFAVTEFTPPALDGIGARYYAVYAAVNWLVVAPTVYLFFPETAGRRLEDVDAIFERSRGLLDPVRIAADMRAEDSKSKVHRVAADRDGEETLAGREDGGAVTAVLESSTAEDKGTARSGTTKEENL